MNYNELALKFKESKKQQDFNVLYDKMKPQLYNWISGFVSNDLADEMLNDTMMIIWDKIERFDPEKANFKTWAWTISKRLCLNQISKRNKKQTYSLDNLVEVKGFDVEGEISNYLDKDRILQLIIDEINKLDEVHKPFFIDVYKHKLDHKSIAKKRKVPSYTVKNRLFNGRKKIKSKLANNKEIQHLFESRNFNFEDLIQI